LTTRIAWPLTMFVERSVSSAMRSMSTTPIISSGGTTSQSQTYKVVEPTTIRAGKQGS
jgi:hypothetical protein